MRERLHAAEAAGGGATSHSRGRGGIPDVPMCVHVGLSIYTPHGQRDHDWVRIIARTSRFMW